MPLLRSRAFLVTVTVAAGVLSAPGTATAGTSRGFDLPAHRGGIGLVVESTLAAFGNALRLGAPARSGRRTPSPGSATPWRTGTSQRWSRTPASPPTVNWW